MARFYWFKTPSAFGQSLEAEGPVCFADVSVVLDHKFDFELYLFTLAMMLVGNCVRSS